MASHAHNTNVLHYHHDFASSSLSRRPCLVGRTRAALIDSTGNYVLQPNAFHLYGLKGNLNFLTTKDKTALTDVGRTWTSHYFDLFPFLDSRQRVGDQPEHMYDRDKHALTFALFLQRSFAPGEKSRFIKHVSDSMKEEILRRYKDYKPDESYFHTPAPAEISDVLSRLTSKRQQDLFRKGDKSDVYTPIFECFRSLSQSEESDWLNASVTGYMASENMKIVLPDCYEGTVCRKHSLVRWAIKKVISPLMKTVVSSERSAFNCHLNLADNVPNDAEKMSERVKDENQDIIVIHSKFTPGSRRRKTDGGASYWVKVDKPSLTSRSTVQRHFLAGVKVARATGMDAKMIKDVLWEVFQEYSEFSPPTSPAETAPAETAHAESMSVTASSSSDTSEECEGNIAGASEACVGVVNRMFESGGDLDPNGATAVSFEEEEESEEESEEMDVSDDDNMDGNTLRVAAINRLQSLFDDDAADLAPSGNEGTVEMHDPQESDAPPTDELSTAIEEPEQYEPEAEESNVTLGGTETTGCIQFARGGFRMHVCNNATKDDHPCTFALCPQCYDKNNLNDRRQGRQTTSRFSKRARIEFSDPKQCRHDLDSLDTMDTKSYFSEDHMEKMGVKMCSECSRTIPPQS